MCPASESPPPTDPEAKEAMSQLRAGIKRARVIVREAKQAIGQTAPEGALLPSGPDPEPDPDPGNPVIPAD